jgi:Protein of unknown function (DUF3995)
MEACGASLPLFWSARAGRWLRQIGHSGRPSSSACGPSGTTTYPSDPSRSREAAAVERGAAEARHSAGGMGHRYHRTRRVLFGRVRIPACPPGLRPLVSGTARSEWLHADGSVRPNDFDSAMKSPRLILGGGGAAVLGGVSVLHLYWAAGGRRGKHAVVPTSDGRALMAPSRAATVAVAVALARPACSTWVRRRDGSRAGCTALGQPARRRCLRPGRSGTVATLVS